MLDVVLFALMVLAFATFLTSHVVLAVALSFWPFQGPDGQTAWAGSVVVQDVGTSEPGRTVMVYSSPDQALTVIWLFPSEVGTEES